MTICVLVLPFAGPQTAAVQCRKVARLLSDKVSILDCLQADVAHTVQVCACHAVRQNLLACLS